MCHAACRLLHRSSPEGSQCRARIDCPRGCGEGRTQRVLLAKFIVLFPARGSSCHARLCRYTVFDKVAVNIRVEEGQHGRRSLVLTLTSREQLPDSELVS